MTELPSIVALDGPLRCFSGPPFYSNELMAQTDANPSLNSQYIVYFLAGNVLEFSLPLVLSFRFRRKKTK